MPDYPLPEVKKPSYDDITPGYWYMKFGIGFFIARVNDEPEGKMVRTIEFGCHKIDIYPITQFIKKVPNPD
jgi:hypothetical protein